MILHVRCVVYLAYLLVTKYLSLILSGVALLYSVDARLRLDLVCIEGPEGHREPLVPIGLGCWCCPVG